MTEPQPTWRSRTLSVLAIMCLFNVPFWNKTLLRWVLKRVVGFLYLIILVTLVLLPFENRLAFPGQTDKHVSAPPLRIREVSLSARDGNTIHAWFTAPDNFRPEQGAILYSHGNGANLRVWGNTIQELRNELNRAVLIYDYPGFGKSTGSPTEQNCYAAIDAAYDWLINEQKVPADKLILFGSSLGGAFATDLASREPCRMLVLINSFTNFPDMAQKSFPILPARWVVSNRMNSVEKITTIHVPVFITHGTADEVIPYWMGERLHQKANEPKRFLRIEGHRHVDPSSQEYFDLLRAFLRQTEPK